MAHFAHGERLILANTLDEVGPDAPTLCDGWTSYDLAAHLVARERRLDSTPGLVAGFAAGWTEHVRQRMKARSYPELVALVRNGPPWWHPMRVPAIDEAANLIEYFVHTEDVRRAQQPWAARDLPLGAEPALWKQLRRLAPRLVRGAPVGVKLDALGVDQLVISDVPETTPLPANEFIAKAGMPEVTVRGLPSELVLFCYGRGSAAQVQFRGDESAINRLRRASLGG